MTALALLRECEPLADASAVCYEITGAAGAPVVAVLGGISASKHVTSSASDPRQGWWEDVVGEGRSIDTEGCRVISIDYLTHSKGSPPITTQDQACALARALDELGID